MKKADPAHDVTSSSATAPTTRSASASSSPTRRSATSRGRPRDATPRSPEPSPTGTTSRSTTRAQVLTSTGHGFAGLSRKRCSTSSRRAPPSSASAALRDGGRPTSRPGASADLVLAADGVNSVVRQRHAAHFRPRHRLAPQPVRLARHDVAVPGLHLHLQGERARAVPRARLSATTRQHSTFIVECTEETLAAGRPRRGRRGRHGRVREALFARELEGHRSSRTARSGAPSRSSATSLAPRQHRAGRRRRPHRALLDRLGHQARDGGRDRARRRPAGPPTTCGGALAPTRRSAGPGRRRCSARRSVSLEWFEETERYTAASSRPVRLQPADAQPADHPRQPAGCATPSS